jgi:hydroxyethylthiazole kinase-like uncharacterized protein yjeF
LTDNALEYVGNLSVIDIGIPEIYEKELSINYVTASFIRKIIPEKRARSAFKNNYGRTMLLGGSDSMSGAIVLAAKAALKTGVGLVNVLVNEDIHPIVASQIPTAMVVPLNEKNGYRPDKRVIIADLDRYDCIVFGPGAGTSAESAAILLYLLKNYKKPLVVDADGINLLAENPGLMLERKDPLIITPHVGELSRLLKHTTKDIQKDRFAALRNFTGKYKGVVTVLKGAKTIISEGKEIYVNSTGNPALARGGTGDILSGLIGGFLAQKIKPLNAAVLGVYLHGLMGDLAVKHFGEEAIITEELLDFIAPAFLEIRKEKNKSDYLLINKTN